jgi:hypothetical protein
MSTYIDIKSIRSKALGSVKSKKAAVELMESVVQDERSDFYNKFENHSVTREIEGGNAASNISNTLGGNGNLFSFIGFTAGTSPTESVKKLIKSIRLIRTSVKVADRAYTANLSVPTLEKFDSVTRMPWERGRSWLMDIELGISGLSAYLYGKYSKSRSGGGIQSATYTSGASFKPVKYFATIYSQFIKKISNKNRKLS